MKRAAKLTEGDLESLLLLTRKEEERRAKKDIRMALMLSFLGIAAGYALSFFDVDFWNSVVP